MKKFLFIAALALMAATIAAPSYGQTYVPEAPDIGMEILCTPVAQMESMCSPVMTEYRFALVNPSARTFWTLLEPHSASGTRL